MKMCSRIKPTQVKMLRWKVNVLVAYLLHVGKVCT